MRFYVRIDGVSDADLGFLGYTLVTEDDHFKLYRDYTGDEHIVYKGGPRFIYVDDPNDAEILRTKTDVAEAMFLPADQA